MKNEQDVNAKLVEALTKKIMERDWKSNEDYMYMLNILESALSSLPETQKAIVPEMSEDEWNGAIEAIKYAMNIKDLWSAQQSGTFSADHEGEMQALSKMEQQFKDIISKSTVTPDKEVSRPMYIDRDDIVGILNDELAGYGDLIVEDIDRGKLADKIISRYEAGHIATNEQRREDKPLTGWISVKDGLPIFNEKVLVYTFADELFIAHRASGIMATGEWYESFRNLQIRSSITHWQPLPEKPKV